MVGAILAYDPSRGLLARRGERGRRGVRYLTFAALILLGSAAAAFAADPRYPDWPCNQIKVPELSVAAIWTGPPIDDVGDTWENDPQ